MIRELLEKLFRREDLSAGEAEAAMGAVMTGQLTPAQVAGLLTALAMKGERPSEVVGFARAMRAHALSLGAAVPGVFDTCGTGGDRAGTFNISTTAAFVAAGGGLTVAKHGNRSVSSKSGSADVLAALGVKIDLPTQRIEDCVNDVGIGFLFAPLFHGAMKHCAAPRQDMGIRTLLNILGPLTNPAGATIQALGVYDGNLTEVMARVLIHLGTQHCFVVHGMDGLDEITLTDRTRVSEGKAGVVSSYFIEPEEFGLQRVKMKELAGGSAEENAQITKDILKGRKSPKQDIVCLNAAPVFVASGKAKNLQEGFALAGKAIDSGAAMQKLEQLIAFTNKP